VHGPFERALWQSRYLVLVAIVASLGVAVVVLGFATADVLRFAAKAVALLGLSEEELAGARLALVAKVVKIVDLYLVATFMLIFAMGLYELFIGRIEAAEESEVGARLLRIHDLDDLKDRLTKIVMLILAMLFLEFALKLTPGTYLELLQLALGGVLIAGALFLSRKTRGLQG